MNAGFSLVADDINDWVWCILLLLPRLLIIMQFWPVFSDALQTLLIKASAAMGLLFLPAVYLLPHVQSLSLVENGIFLFLLTESVLGIVMGLALALPLYAVRAFGALVDVLRGATFAVIYSPVAGDEELTLERLAALGFGVWLLLTPMWAEAVELIYDSYRIWPPSSQLPVDLSEAWQVLLSLFSRHLEWSLRYFAPVMVLVLLAEVALYLISGYASNIQTYSIDAALKALVCIGILVVLSIYAPDSNLNLVSESTSASLSAFRQWLGRSP